MTAPRLRWSLIGVWLACTCIAFFVIDNVTARSLMLLLVFAVIPPTMLLWRWNENRPLVIGSLYRRQKQL
jgi:hypothetical protein